MLLCKWEKLPDQMQIPEVREYYDILKQRTASLLLKRAFDVVVSLLMLIVLSPLFLVIAVCIKLDSPGPVFYRQVRITQYGREFRIHKFRSMVDHADRGSKLTVKGDARVTRVGRFIRKYRLDEISQLLDILVGDMSFVGTRPEVPKYVAAYTPEMMATLLLPAGVTSLTSIKYKDEATLLDATDDPDRVYIEEILPGKMYYNLDGLRNFSCLGDLKLMSMTLLAVLGKEF